MAYREPPPPQPQTGPCIGCRYLIGDYCCEDGIKLAPGACEYYERSPTIGEMLRRLLGRSG